MIVKRKIHELRVSELRSELEKRCLDGKGLKSTLLQRLQKAIFDEGGDGIHIELESSCMTGSSIGKKNSPRVKKKVEASTSIVQGAKSENDRSESKNESKTEENQPQMHPDDDAKLDKSWIKEVDGMEFGEKQGEEAMLPEKDANLQFCEAAHTGKENQEANNATSSEATNSFIPINLESIKDNSDILQEKQSSLNEIKPPTECLAINNDVEIGIGKECHNESATENMEDTNIAEEKSNESQLITGTALQNMAFETGSPPCERQDNWSKQLINEGVVNMEEDVLDMLDYDIEIPEQASHIGVNLTGSMPNMEGKERLLMSKEVVLQRIEDKQHSTTEMDDTPIQECQIDQLKNSITTVKSTSIPTELKDDKGQTVTRNREESKNYKNLWISGLSVSTRARELKVAFGRYGKVVGAKVVTNARSPGSKCYGFVAMATVAAANKCILHLNRTEMHGRYITVERTKSDPSASKKDAKNNSTKLSEEKGGKTKNSSHENIDTVDLPIEQSSSSKESFSDSLATNEKSVHDDVGKIAVSTKLAINETDKQLHTADTHSEIELEVQMPNKTNIALEVEKHSQSNRKLSSSGVSSQLSFERDTNRRLQVSHRSTGSKRKLSDEPPHRHSKSVDNGERKVVIDNKKGEMSLRVNVSSSTTKRTRSPIRSSRMLDDRRTRGFLHRRAGNVQSRAARLHDRYKQHGFGKPKIRSSEVRTSRSIAATASLQRDRLILHREREQRNLLRQEREKLEKQRKQLERDRQERERLERERSRLEHERKKELEKIEKEKAEMRRLQEISRYEQSQRHRAIKRSYDGSSYDKRGDRDDRRYHNDLRERNDAGHLEHTLHHDEMGYRARSSGDSNLTRFSHDTSKGFAKPNYHDVDRRGVPHNDTDARYGSSRRVEKYDRSDMKTNSSYGHDRRSSNEMAYRNTERHPSDDRKVVSRERSRINHSDNLRRSELSMRKEPGANNRAVSPTARWKDSKVASSSSRIRSADRDLREEIPRHGTDHNPGTGSNRKPPEVGRNDMRHKDDSALNRRAARAGLQSVRSFTGNEGGIPIPTQTGRSGNNCFHSDAWSDWQQGGRNNPGNVWQGGIGTPVGRVMQPPNVSYGSIPSSLSMPGGAMVGQNVGSYIGSDRTESYKEIRRY